MAKWKSARDEKRRWLVKHFVDYKGFHIEVENMGPREGFFWSITKPDAPDWSMSGETEGRSGRPLLAQVKGMALEKVDAVIDAMKRGIA
jgi:hypothetical protein